MSGELTNSDFRAIIDNLDKEKNENKSATSSIKKENKSIKKQKYLTKKKKDDKQIEQRYRDRAEERRKGIIKDVKDASVLYNNVNNTIDESKFMGGDIEHTHLVKGLDFLLLNKVRNKLINKINLEKEKVSKNQLTTTSTTATTSNILYNKIPTFVNEDSKHIFKYFFIYEHPHHIHFKNKIENLHNNIINNMKFKSFNRNIHLINYKVNIDFGIDKNDVPIKCIHNIDDIKLNKSYYINDLFLNQIDECFKWHAENKKKKKHERLSKRPLTANFLQNKQIPEEEEYIDIFKTEDVAVSNNINTLESNLVEGTVGVTNNNNSDDDRSSSDSSNNDNSTITKPISSSNQECLDKTVTDDNINLNHFFNLVKKKNNLVPNESKNSLTQNVFTDTYMECYPGY
ncbi:RED-like protein, putative [Hepatocystis sp. ex Piliocolobus tephrosceles]|nr:RED-like protein, putative [Hepatocystis sp. ex Piliocolobus tephrosceles]